MDEHHAVGDEIMTALEGEDMVVVEASSTSSRMAKASAFTKEKATM